MLILLISKINAVKSIHIFKILKKNSLFINLSKKFPRRDPIVANNISKNIL